MKVCYIMCPWNEVEPDIDSSILMIHEGVKRGHEVSMATPDHLGVRDGQAIARCQVFKKDQPLSDNLEVFHVEADITWVNLKLKDFDIIVMRADPPMDYLMLNFLDSVKDDVFIVNSLRGLRNANNKVYTATYFDPENEIIPITHISKNVDYLLSVINESPEEKMIMKPLDGHGGKGVIVIEKSASSNLKSLLDFYINHSGTDPKYVILQEFIPEAKDGDVRVFVLNGEPIGAIRRVPGKGEIRSNISAGGYPVRYDLTEEDKDLCRKIGKKLVADGICFAGLDIIGGKLIEVNVMSPGALNDYNQLNNANIQVKVIDYLEQVLSGHSSNC